MTPAAEERQPHPDEIRQELVVKGKPNSFELSRAVQEMCSQLKALDPAFRIYKHVLTLSTFAKKEEPPR